MKYLVEIRTAYFVGNLGSVTAAAKRLGIHRATVQRHIDTLEQEIGRKIFLRHPNGYTVSDVGEQLLASAKNIEEQVESFIGLAKVQAPALEGELVIASTPPGYSPIVIAAVSAFREQYPDVSVGYNVVDRPPRLELGEAHIYFHFGPKLDLADYVLLPWMKFSGGIYGHKEYFARFGNPTNLASLADHRFALLTGGHYSPPDDWIRDNVPEESIIFRSNDRPTIWRAISDGLALGCIADHLATTASMIEPIALALPTFESICWSVTHVDAHRAPKVNAFLACLKGIGLMGVNESDVDEELMPKV